MNQEAISSTCSHELESKTYGMWRNVLIRVLFSSIVREEYI